MNIKKDKLRRIITILLEKEVKEEKTPIVIGDIKFMCKSCELAKIITNECYNRSFPISAAKLQKLLVLMHGEHLAENDKVLFPENVVRWKCGVAIKEVELKFLLHDFSKKESMPEKIAVLKTEEIVIKKVLDEYGNQDVLEINKDRRLEKLTTLYPFVEGQKTIIPNEVIKKVFIDYGPKV